VALSCPPKRQDLNAPPVRGWITGDGRANPAGKVFVSSFVFVVRFVAVVLAAFVAACTAPAPATEADYTAELLQDRAEKDQFFREGRESPVPADQRAMFPPLPYFPPDPEYRVPASLEPAASVARLEMLTSTGQRRMMRRLGTLRFVLKGQPLQLTAFTESNEPSPARLFVPFGDFTNGTESYPAGRYLDLDRTATGIYDLDFNRAYHPYCLYNPTYDCPLPPPENRLKVPVRAGERLPITRGQGPEGQ
jgi:hypothetical protein